jgi:hypothetical protein
MPKVTARKAGEVASPVMTTGRSEGNRNSAVGSTTKDHPRPFTWTKTADQTLTMCDLNLPLRYVDNFFSGVALQR